MIIQPNNRVPYSAINARPDFTWPGGKRLAVYTALAVEHFSYGTGMGISYSPGIDHPNTYNYAWREYGNRVGGWRLLDLYEAYEQPLSILLNTACYDHCPELISAFVEKGHEIIAHGQTNAEHPGLMEPGVEAKMLRKVTEDIKNKSGVAPKGWMSPGANPSAQTEDLLAKNGYLYTLDWPMDDQPAWMSTKNGPLLSVPYPHEVNDVPMIVIHHGTAPAFADMAIDNITEMLKQSKEQALACGITIHSFIMGQPYRIHHLRRVLEHLNANSDEIWFATPGEIAEHYAAQFKPEAENA